jgi:hypothetical protein
MHLTEGVVGSALRVPIAAPGTLSDQDKHLDLAIKCERHYNRDVTLVTAGSCERTIDETPAFFTR